VARNDTLSLPRVARMDKSFLVLAAWLRALSQYLFQRGTTPRHLKYSRNKSALGNKAR
jgi:hypothetical protein